jgi:hypothetical protein
MTRLSHLIVLVGIIGVTVFTAGAQQSPRLLFEVSVDGSLVARPEMRVPLGGEGRLELDERHGQVRVTFRPSAESADHQDSPGRDRVDVEREGTSFSARRVLGSIGGQQAPEPDKLLGRLQYALCSIPLSEGSR